MRSLLILTAALAITLCGSSPVVKDASNVVITLYYETMCPDCIRYDTTILYPTYKELQDIMDIVYVPYGKAKTIPKPSGSGYDFTCQHGPKECQGNMVHACAVEYVKDAHLLSDYLNCMIKKSSTPLATGESCAKALSIDWAPIGECSIGLQGEELLAANGERTHSLFPTLHSVPTVELNGCQDNQELLISNLKKAVCNAYGGPKPDACL